MTDIDHNEEHVDSNGKSNGSIVKVKKQFNCSVTYNNIHKYLVVFGSFIVYFIADGVSLSFGIFIREFISVFRKSVAQTSIIAGLIQAGPLFLSPLVCLMIDKFGCRLVAFLGSIFLVLSFVLTKFFVKDIVSLYLTLGGVASCGLAMSYIPAYLIISFYFDKRRALATGIAVSGSGLGVFAMAPLMETLIDANGWLDACFIFGAISSHMLISACLFRSPTAAAAPTPETETETAIDSSNNSKNKSDEASTSVNQNKTHDPIEQKLLDKSKKNKCKRFLEDVRNAFKIIYSLYCNKRFLLINVSYTISAFLITAPYNFLPAHLQQMSIEDEYSLSISFIGISTLLGQIVIGFMADRFRHHCWLIYSVSLIISGITTSFLPLLKHIYLIYGYSLVFGFTISVNYVLQSILVIEAVGLTNLTHAFGFLQLMQGFSTLTGVPAVAYFKDLTGKYNTTFYITGGIVALSGSLLLLWPLCGGDSNNKKEKEENNTETKEQTEPFI